MNLSDILFFFWILGTVVTAGPLVYIVGTVVTDTYPWVMRTSRKEVVGWCFFLLIVIGTGLDIFFVLTTHQESSIKRDVMFNGLFVLPFGFVAGVVYLVKACTHLNYMTEQEKRNQQDARIRELRVRGRKGHAAK